jgi:hypothetical protein
MEMDIVEVKEKLVQAEMQLSFLRMKLSAAEDAKTVAENAKTAAEDAKTVAENAKRAAENAKGAAENAKRAAENAKTVAENAKRAAENAKTAAEDAKTAAEDAKTAAENALHVSEGYGFLINRGLPPLSKSTVSTSHPNYGNHTSVNDSIVSLVLDVEIDIPEHCLLSNLRQNLPSKIWKSAEGEPRMLQCWNNEAQIESWVHSVLLDITNILGVFDKLKVCCQISITLVKELIPDILVFSIGGVLVGVCEVKKPSHEKNDLADINQNLQNQISNYLQQMKYVHGIKTPIGIITTYNEWRICFLRESCDLMIKKSTQGIGPQSAPREIPSQPSNHVQLFVSRVYNYNEPALIEVLAATIDKMLSSFSTAPTSLLRELNGEPRKFGCLRDDTFEWKALPRDLKLTYQMPEHTKWFYFIQDFHGGRDGRVWLTLSEAGKLAVLKMSKERSYEREANLWNAIWDVNCRTLSFNDAKALVMPVVFHGGEVDECKFFRPIGPKWSVGVCTEEDIRDSEVECFFDDSLSKYFNNPILAAKEAIERMADRGYEHLDLHWRHVGLLPYMSEEGSWAVRPVLIDLSDVRNIDLNEKSTVISKSLHVLNITSELEDISKFTK